MALGEPGQLVVPGDHDRRAEVAGRDAVDRRRDRPERCGQVGRQGEGDEDGQQAGQDDHQEEQAGDGRLGIRQQALGGDDRDPERGERQDGGRDEGEGQPGPERDAARVELGLDRRALALPCGRILIRGRLRIGRLVPIGDRVLRPEVARRLHVSRRRPMPDHRTPTRRRSRPRRCDQPVADAANGEQVGRPVRVGLELRPEPAHGDPHVRRVGRLGLRPAPGEEGLGRDHLAEVRGQGVEQPRFGRGEGDDLAAHERLPPMELEDEPRAQDQAAPGHLVADPPQDPVDPGPQLGVVVRLRDVVLGDLVEDLGLAVAGVDRAQDDDRQVRPALDLAGQGEAVEAGHHHVDDQEVRPAALEPAERLDAVTGGRDLEAVGPELLGQDHQQVRVVVDDEDPRGHGLIGPGRTSAQHAHEYRSGADAAHDRSRSASAWSGPIGAREGRTTGHHDFPPNVATPRRTSRRPAGVGRASMLRFDGPGPRRPVG